MSAESSNPGFLALRIRWQGLVTAGGALVGMASLLGFLGSWHWTLDLCSHFRVQYLVLLVAVTVLHLLMRQRRAAVVFGALALVDLGVILPLYLGKESVAAPAGAALRVMLVNVDTQRGRPEDVSDAIRRFDPDVLVLEEVDDRWMSSLAPALSGYAHRCERTRDDNFGIALLSRHPFTQARVIGVGGAGVPSILAEVAAPQGRFSVLATHPLPPSGRRNFELRNGQLAEIARLARQAPSPLLLVGDLNTTNWNHYFQRLLETSGLRDSSQGRGVDPTWPAFNILMRIPIDHVLHTPAIGIVDRQVGPDVGSDHFPVVVDFVIRPEPEADAGLP